MNNRARRTVVEEELKEEHKVRRVHDEAEARVDEANITGDAGSVVDGRRDRYDDADDHLGEL